MPNAKLYEVNLPRGIVYALHDLSSGMIWTERSEQAARQLAVEKRLDIIEEETISHEQLLRLIGHEPPVPKTSGIPNINIENPSDSPTNPGAIDDLALTPVSPPPLRHRLDYQPHLAAIDVIVIPKTKSGLASNVFCSGHQITPSAPPATAENKIEEPNAPQQPPSKPK